MATMTEAVRASSTGGTAKKRAAQGRMWRWKNGPASSGAPSLPSISPASVSQRKAMWSSGSATPAPRAMPSRARSPRSSASGRSCRKPVR